MRGRDIKRFSYDFADLYLINTHNGIEQKGIPPVKIDNYPAVKKHLDTYYSKLKERDDKGITPYNLRSCAYMEEFNKQKIAFPAIMTGGAFFSIVPKEYMVVAPGNIITGTNIIPLESFLTSDVCYFALRHFYMGGGIEGELKVNRLLLLPIPLNIENRKHSLHDIQKLYKLTDEEMKFISSSVRSK